MAKGELALLEKVQNVLAAPGKFYDGVKGEEGLSKAFIYYSILLAVSLVLTQAVSTVMGAPLSKITVIGVVAAWLLVNGLNFVIVAIVHVFVYLLGGKAGYGATYRAMSYASTPMYLLNWIPIVGLAGALWSLYLDIKGIAVLQNMSTGRAAAAVLIPLVILLIIALVLFAAALAAILGSGGLVRPSPVL